MFASGNWVTLFAACKELLYARQNYHHGGYLVAKYPLYAENARTWRRGIVSRQERQSEECSLVPVETSRDQAATPAVTALGTFGYYREQREPESLGEQPFLMIN